MRGLLRVLLLPFASLTLVLTSLSVPAYAAAPDTWVKWDLGDVWIRSLDYVNGTQLIAGSETSGVFTASSAAGPWSDISGNLSALGKQVRQAVGQSGQIYLATSAGLFQGTGNGSWSQLGVADSTPEPQRLNQGGVQSVVFPTGQASYLVAGTAGTGKDGVFFSSDSGATWTKSSGLTGAVFYLTGNASAMYAAASTGFWKSTDSGQSWVLRSDGIPSGESAKRIAVSPINAQQLIAATVGSVYRSDNGGTSWYAANGSGAGLLNVSEVRAFQLVPSQYWAGGLPTIVVGTNNGVWTTVDGGLTWAKMAGAKLNAPGEVTMAQESVYALNIGFGAPGSLIAGTQGHGIFALPLQAAEVPATVPAPIGNPVKNVVLTAQTGTWTGTAPYVFGYQWKRCTTSSAGSCSNISGENDSTYQLGQLDVGNYVRVGVRGRNLVMSAFGAEAVSAAVGPVAAPPGFEPTPPSNYPKLVNGVSAPWGTTMSIDESDDPDEDWKSNGTYTATTFKYQWSRCDTDGDPCVELPGATSRSYTTQVGDVNHVVKAEVIGTIAGTSSPKRVAGSSLAVYEKLPVNTSAPVVVGPAYIGTLLQSTAGAWTGTKPTFTRRWLRCNAQGVQCGVTSPVLTTPTFPVTAADTGYTFRLEVTATVTDDFQDRTQTVESAPSAVVGAAPVVSPPVVVTPPSAACAALGTQLAKAQKSLTKATKALKKAKKSGVKAKVKKAKAKVKAAKKKVKKAKAAQAAAGC